MTQEVTLINIERVLLYGCMNRDVNIWESAHPASIAFHQLFHRKSVGEGDSFGCVIKQKDGESYIDLGNICAFMSQIVFRAPIADLVLPVR